MFDAMIAAFSLYFAGLLSIGLYFYKKTTNQSEFSLGNRSLNYWLTAIAAQASDMSDWLFMGFPGAIYLLGISGIWFAFGLALFMFLTWQFIAPQLRRQTESHNALTLASFFQTKFQDSSHLIKIISGFFCLYFFTFYIAAGIVGLGKAFELIFEMPYHHGIIIGLAVSLMYTLLGGLLAVAWSNLIQGIFLLSCIIFVPLYAINVKLGGFAAFHQSLQLFGSDYFSLLPPGGILATCMAILKWGPGYFGQPHILINFMSINDPNNLSKAKWVGCSWQVLALSAAVFVGIVGKVMLFPTLTDPELVFIVMVKQLFTPFFAGLILCSILAATISTINIQSLICASLITQDLYFPLFNQTSSEKTQLLFTRLAIFIVPIFSLLIAWNKTGVWDLVLYAWSGLGVTFGPIVILSLYSKQLNKYGVMAGLVSGGLSAIFWPLNHAIPVMVIGYTINYGVALVTSLITTVHPINKSF